MTTFAYTTGNPANLTGGANASMNDIQGGFTDLRTFLNGGNLTTPNVAPGGLADTALASPTNAVWRPILGGTMLVSCAAMAASTVYYLAGPDGSIVQSGTTSPTAPVIWVPITAADVAVAGKTTKVRLRASLSVNGAAPAVNVTLGFYPVTGLAGGAGQIIPTLGAALMTTVFATPAAAGGYSGASAMVDYPAVSGYTFGALIPAGSNNASRMTATVALEMAHV